jgi:hypothetical protein
MDAKNAQEQQRADNPFIRRVKEVLRGVQENPKFADKSYQELLALGAAYNEIKDTPVEDLIREQRKGSFDELSRSENPRDVALCEVISAKISAATGEWELSTTPWTDIHEKLDKELPENRKLHNPELFAALRTLEKSGRMKGEDIRDMLSAASYGHTSEYDNDFRLEAGKTANTIDRILKADRTGGRAVNPDIR